MADQKVSDLPSLNGADVDPADLLYIVDSSAGSAGSKKITVGQYQLAPVSGGTANGVVYLNGSKVVTTGSGLVFDGSNLGLGVTPSAWNASFKAYQVGNQSLWSTAAGNGYISNNAFFNTSNQYIYRNTGYATEYIQSIVNGSHAWFTAPSGTAGNAISFTQAMTLDAGGNLLVGVTSFSGFRADILAPNTDIAIRARTSSNNEVLRVESAGTANSAIRFINTSVNNTYISADGTALTFLTGGIEHARITSGGNLLVGTTADAGSNTKLAVKNTTAGGSTGYLWNASTSGDSIFLSFGTEATITTRGSIDYNRAGGLVRYNTTSDYRAKDIIGPVQNSGATIDALKVYEGRMKGASQSRPMLIAHEAQAHAPYAVSGVKDEVNEDGTPKFQQIDVSSLVPLLLAEIQSLRARVAALESA